MTMMSNEEEKRCPLCAEEMDWTDQQFKPCKCGYQVCVWCWHHIMDIAEKEASEGRCPACRTKYEKDKVVAMQANFERAENNNSNRKSKPPKAKPKANEVRKDLTNVRVIQRKMAYVTGLPLSLADEDLLQRKEYFGQYGKISKISLSRTAGGSIQLLTNDTCSVYITYSKEEDAIQCIQFVHGFVLEGRYLRASFGTAKYCHAWLRNMPCSNPSCLYLHSLGADEDSFGKDEVAAIHTRSRVQQIVGATSSAMKRSGNVLPPPIDELSNTSFTSTENSTIRSAGVTNDTVDHRSYMARVVPSSDKDGGAGEPNGMTSFVDVGLSNSSRAEKDGNSSEDSRILDLCSNLSSIPINKDNHAQETYSDRVLFEVPSPNQPVNHLRDQNTTEISDEPFREDSTSFDGQRSKDLNSICQEPFLMSSRSAKCTEDYGGNSLLHRACSSSINGMEHRSLHNQAEETLPPLSCVNSTLNDGLHDLKFQSSVKSDTIYRGSNSFSNEEIVEHLRRTENGSLNNFDESSAFNPVKNSIISNILAMDFGSCENSLTSRHSLTGLCNEPNGQRGSWNSLHSGQGFSFMKQDGFSSQRADLDSSSNISLMSNQSSILHDFRERKEQHMHESQYQISRPKGLAPPGFSIPSRDLPPGFPLSDEIGGFPHTLSVTSIYAGSQLVNSSSNLIHPPSTRSTRTAGEADFVDPAILSCGKGKPTNGLSISGLEVGSQRRALEDEARLWLLMQQNYADQEGKFSRVLASQTPSAHLEQRFHGADEYAGLNDLRGFSSRMVDQRQNLDQSLYAHLSQQKLANGHSSNGYHHNVLDEFQCRNEVGRMAELQRNDRLGLNGYYAGNGNLTFQGSRSGDVFARVFGM
ncbi:uncharacterized protein [Nicotiana sylvestris]|uniref:Uncharacterized protein isoform X2 n=2 Tax=Nicotiana TaxID=4085 RepID=A0A1S3Y698_TOBAC|nr:PREDICTED: uncharacterized protein LOC104238274 isoform X2 [Nicotiana sylvestris]XP_016447605.1 PREDICTED: uncharacterized protein LOC107772630 isoform X2 [Nicotiana tabacum]